MGRRKVAILGSGNIGADLLMKVRRSDILDCGAFIGRNAESRGLRLAQELGVPTSDRGIQHIVENPDCCDIVFDATSAQAHLEHAPILRNLGKITIDLTPARVGKMCVPAVNLESCLSTDNVNMVTCGGQASIPIAHALGRTQTDIDYIEVVSSIASKSAGPATRFNLDEYVHTTERGVQHFSGAKRVKAILNLNPAVPCIDMQTTIMAKVPNPDLDKLKPELERTLETLSVYVPGYELLVGPVIENGRIFITIKVRGLGDYLPVYAGNLDIINCAAMATAEQFAEVMNSSVSGVQPGVAEAL